MYLAGKLSYENSSRNYGYASQRMGSITGANGAGARKGGILPQTNRGNGDLRDKGETLTDMEIKCRDYKTGIAWYEKGGRISSMKKEDEEKLRQLCQDDITYAIQKFGQAGLVRSLNPNTYAYVGEAGIVVRTKDGQEQLFKTPGLDYSAKIDILKQAQNSDNFLDSGIWDPLIFQANKENTRPSGMEQAKDRAKVPYGYLAEDGVINYNGVVFVCDELHNRINLGDMSNENDILTIPLEEGGCLRVNRDSIGTLMKAITMFSPEDVNRIMRAIALDAKVQQMKNEIEDEKNSIGDSADQTVGAKEPDAASESRTEDYPQGGRTGDLPGNVEESIKKAWTQARASSGLNRITLKEENEMHYLTQLQIQMLLGEKKEEGSIFGSMISEAWDFAKQALDHLENPAVPSKDEKIRQLEEQEKQFYRDFLKNLEQEMEVQCV